jgi:hypothetical protein
MFIVPLFNIILVVRLTSAMSTTTFESILVAHTAAPYCPTPSAGTTWNADVNYIACCEDGPLWTMTLTTAIGYGKQTVYACCETGYSCTGVPTPMSDWTLNAKSKFFSAWKLYFQNLHFIVPATDFDSRTSSSYTNVHPIPNSSTYYI